MKLYYEEENQVTFEQELTESSSTPRYKISGIFSTIGEKNKNGRVYPRTIWESQVKKYQDTLSKGASNSLMELNHPPRANVDMMEAVAKISKLYISDDRKYVMGEAFLLDNPKANQLKTLIDAGIKMSVSSRGVGKVSSSGLVEDFKLSTYDIIPDQGQSDYNAEMMGIVEGVLTEKEFEILENGCVGECELPGTVINESKEVNEEVSDFQNLSILKDILEARGVSILCDLSHEDKEEVLAEFAELATYELAEQMKKYEKYVTESFTKVEGELNRLKFAKSVPVTEKVKIKEEIIVEEVSEELLQKRQKAQELIDAMKNA